MVSPHSAQVRYREDIWQRSEGVWVKLNASRDRSACVWTLDEQSTHSTLLSTSFPKDTSHQALAAAEIGNDAGDIKCRHDDRLGAPISLGFRSNPLAL
jgi:hypothetical protein